MEEHTGIALYNFFIKPNYWMYTWLYTDWLQANVIEIDSGLLGWPI